MAAKQTQPTKRQIPDRSVMLTRFKLSQQKRQLREKERKTSESKGSSVQKMAENKKFKSKNTPSKNKKENEEFHPSKKKRKIASKKVLLKPRHSLKVIGDGTCKRKLNFPQKGLKSPPAKRKKTLHDFNSDYSEEDRSQSPVYAELGFEEVIRMVDENQSLDDDDFLEILTCPSPVWWEDPPDDSYIEDPITITEISPNTTTLPTLVKKIRSKSSRKNTPHKLILEEIEPTVNNTQGDKQDLNSILDDATLKNINKTDDKFINKRSKLESLLGTIKNKLKESKCQNNNIITKEDSKENCKDNDVSEIKPINITVPNRSKKESETELDDITFANISEQDKNSLIHLENIEIPIEGKSNNVVNDTKEKPPVDIRKTIINPNGMLKVIKKSKNITSYISTKNLKILKINKMSMNSFINKKHAQIKIIPAKSILKGQSMLKTTEIPQSEKQHIIIKENDTISQSNKPLSNNDDKDIQSENNNQNLSVKEKILDQSIPIKENTESEEFVTIFQIVSNTNDIKENETKVDLEEMKQKNEITDKESKKLDSYYRKCKGRKRDFTKTNFKDEKKDIQKEEFVDEEELCDNCDKNSIIVPSTTDVKYCLKCSSIFNLDECDYCIRKAKFLKKSDSVDSVDDFCISNIKNPQNYENKNIGIFEDTPCV